MKVLLLLAVLANTVYVTYSLCGVCSATTNLACVDVNKFAVCSGGVPQLNPIDCPTGTICTPNSLCAEPSATSPPACDSCGKCNDVFACKTYNTFSLCYGTGSPNAIEYTCPNNLVCNLESPSICSEPTGLGSTCSILTMPTTPATTKAPVTEPTVTTTINPITDPEDFCKSKGRGRFDVPSDKKCSQYVNCYQINGVWYGNVYLCPSSTHFNQTSQMCGKGVPQRCSSIQEVCD